MKWMLSVLSVCVFAGAAQAGQVTVAVGEDGTKVGGGILKAEKNGLNAEVGNMFGVGNTADVGGMVYYTYSTLAGSTLPDTIQPGTYILSARVGNTGDHNGYAGLNDISSGTNTNGGNVAGFFETLSNSGNTQADATANKNNMYTEFNAISGVTYTAPTEAAPAADTWTTWTYTWDVAEGSPMIDSDPYFAVYTRTGSGGGSNGYWDDSILTFIPAGGGNIAPTATAQDLTIFPGASTNITLTGTDFEGSNLTYQVVDFPAEGDLDTNSIPNVIYTPTSGTFVGIDSFTFLVNDGDLDSTPATITITVTNQVPTADAQSVVTFTDTALDITLAGSDPDNGPDTLTYDFTDPAHGTLTGTAPDLTYNPDPGYTGDDSFAFTVNDGVDDSAAATISIKIKEPAVSGAATISVNFHVGDDADAQDDHELTGAEAAGLDENTTWNNINVGAGSNTPGTIFPSTVLTDNKGNTSAATIAPSVASTWFAGYSANARSVAQELNLAGTNHDDLFNSYLALNGPGGDGSPADAAILEISGLGDAYTDGGYTLIVYSDSDRRNTSSNSRRSVYTVVSGGVTNTVFVEDDDPADTVNIFDGTYIESDNVEDGPGYSNYTVLSNLTAGSFSIEITSPDGGRGAISGFQIVANEVAPTSVEGFGGSMVSGGTALALSWEAVSYASYGVEATADLVHGSWTKIITGIDGADGVDGILTVTNAVTEDLQFFRAYVEDQE